MSRLGDRLSTIEAAVVERRLRHEVRVLAARWGWTAQRAEAALAEVLACELEIQRLKAAGRSEDQIVVAIAERYGKDPQALRAEVESVQQELLAAGLDPWS